MLHSKLNLTSQNQTNSVPTVPDRPWRKRGWQSWLIAKPFDWVMTPLCIGTCLVFFAYLLNGSRDIQHHEWWDILIVVGTMLSFLIADRLEYWYYGDNIPTKVAAPLFAARILLLVVVIGVSDFDFSAFFYLIMPVTATFYFGVVAGFWTGGIVWLLGVAITLYYTVPDGLTGVAETLTVYTITLLLIVTLTKMVSDERRARQRAETLLAELEASHRRITEMATVEERNRLARDIHDSLGHYLTIVNIQLEKALTLRDHHPAEAEAAVREAKRLSSETLQEVRWSVGTLRSGSEAFALEKALTELVANLGHEHLTIDLQLKGSEHGYARRNLMVLFRAVQEGLTNVQRHAAATKASVLIDFGPELATLLVKDDGRGFDPKELVIGGSTSGGYGLQGLQERVELVGGTLAIESQPGNGTRLVVTLPKKSQLHLEPVKATVLNPGLERVSP